MFEQSALILVDIQNDFCPGGSLAVAHGDEVVEVVNRLMPLYPLVVATQDWHPANHSSFKEQGGIWPPHCIQGTPGAQLHPKLNQQEIDLYFRKAFTQESDAFSGFEGETDSGELLDATLKKQAVNTLFVTGLATDYCVKATVIDGLINGYAVYVVTDAVRAVDVNEGDDKKAMAEMQAKGAHLISSAEILSLTKAASVNGD